MDDGRRCLLTRRDTLDRDLSEKRFRRNATLDDVRRCGRPNDAVEPHRVCGGHFV